MSYQLFNGNLNNLSDSSKTVINTINQYSFCVAERDNDFKEALMDSDVLLPDGIGIVLAVKSVTGHGLKKISGTDLHENLLERLNSNNGRCFYLGSNKNTLQKITDRLNLEYPAITCETYSPTYKAHFGDEENAEMINAINLFQPDVLFVGMTAPKQEKWVHQHKGKINAQFICSIGAVFDFYAGTVKRPSKFWIDLGLEWFIRLCKEPKRMWKRYFYYGPVFAWALLKEKLRNHPHSLPTAK
ncbi:N-acetylglucosaminyldiphosphoundecaprenol N-acetyl-beta-D-mannosaminyltransferase [Mucilaginibacter frigoritolerans]|uniref:N-acetylglucosaminyldiphosphoundecaprenol N-acetyl-beta-D-mannosaminyltransferase n=2 Tax=Mucilaginibacter frigoritolerans TaxID=652788 RepID=A0A562U4D4_9SPHI|nr:N-acetylglucosaminyldiphosphoundecaprenol N-acetyl-beta-D-mannosaminyltransferase [Mucilaginibacter frigoritolerans]